MKNQILETNWSLVIIPRTYSHISASILIKKLQHTLKAFHIVLSSEFANALKSVMGSLNTNFIICVFYIINAINNLFAFS